MLPTKSFSSRRKEEQKNAVVHTYLFKSMLTPFSDNLKVLGARLKTEY
jgi:hypothetical protein